MITVVIPVVMIKWIATNIAINPLKIVNQAAPERLSTSSLDLFSPNNCYILFASTLSAIKISSRFKTAFLSLKV